LHQLNQQTRKVAEPIIAAGGAAAGDPQLEEVNLNCQRVHEWVAEQVSGWRAQGKWVGLVGGEHSTALGAVASLSQEFPQLGVLQIDAHADLREAYEGFTYSHASIMHNVIARTSARLVQVGIRDFCDSEYEMATRNERITTYWDYALKDRLFQGQSWHQICTEIVEKLPERVYVSFDIDGLEAWLCPHTGTPVPGGLSFHQATYLLKCLVQSGRQIVGFDLNEVAPGAHGEWDGNVGARVLYKLCGLLLYSQGGRDR
jgi:agmatinase